MMPTMICQPKITFDTSSIPSRSIQRALRFAQRYGQEEEVWQREGVQLAVEQATGMVLVERSVARMLVPRGL